MCRIAAYLGPVLPLKTFLLEPSHSLVDQAWRPREMRTATMNVDGFGFGWYTDEGEPAVYLNPMPIWSDVNLPHLGRALRSQTWIANVRSATGGLASNSSNTQPYLDEDLMFVHNGLFDEFATRFRPWARRQLHPEIEARIQGTSDSEYLFALLRQYVAEEPDLPLETALARLLEDLEPVQGQARALMNLIVTDGIRLVATRHALNSECPSLYFTADDDAFPGGILVASERLTDNEYWQPVPPHHLLILDPDEPPLVEPL